MMQAAKSGFGYYHTTRADVYRRDPARRRLLLQREVRSVLVVVADILAHQSFQMSLVEHDHMVEQIPATVANPAFGDAVLPGTSEAGPFGRNAETLNSCASPKYRRPVVSWFSNWARVGASDSS
jgi:hypothetical protein